MAFELLFLYSERKWRPSRKNRQKNLSLKSTAEGIILQQMYFRVFQK